MLDQATETYVVVVRCTPLGKNNYKIELSNAEGNIFDITVHEETVVEYRLVVGKTLDQATFRMLQDSKDYQKAYHYAINVLARRMHTEKELERKLNGRKVAPHVIEDVLAKLLEIELLNDVDYAKAYIETQMKKGTKSWRRINNELRTRGVSENIIDQWAHLYDKETERVILSKVIAQLCSGLTLEEARDFTMRKKIAQRIGYKGFDFEDIQRQYTFFIEDLEAQDNESSL